jgi:hypothetical protein
LEPAPEVMLAQEQAVVNRGIGLSKEVEAAFDVGKETEGTLILTNQRLLYAHGSEKEDSLPIGIFSTKRLIYTDVTELESVASDPANFTIALGAITSAVGHHRPAGAPRLEVRWEEEGAVKSTEFVQQIIGGRRRNLNDWAQVIMKLKSGGQKIRALPPLPPRDSLKGRIALVLGDMQEKGLITIEERVEEEFGVDLDPDQVEEACDELAAEGLLRKSTAAGEDEFYQKVSPLDDDLDE